MLIYHGTAAKYLPKILDHGLMPRGRRKGNWKHSVDSRNDCVYLTTAYAPYFGMCATTGKNPIMLIEMETDYMDEELLLPDEDFLEQATRTRKDMEPHGWNTTSRTEWFRERLPEFQHHWMDSVKHMGTCCHQGGIDVAAITRAVTWRPMEHPNLAMEALDPSISIMNYRFCGDKYRELTAKLFELGTPVLEFNE